MASLRAALESALAENPDDLAAHMAYADYLHEQGDPRGDFIQVQLALENPSLLAADRKRLEEREQELLDAHQAEWIGDAAGVFSDEGGDEVEEAAEAFGMEVFTDNGFKVGFVRGWIDSLNLIEFNADFAKALGRSPMLALLRKLTIRHSDYYVPGYKEMVRWPCLRNVRTFQLGDEADQCHISGAGIAEAIAAMPRLEELGLYASPLDSGAVFALDLPNLRSLTVNHLDNYSLDVLANNASLKNLLSLSCWPHALNPGDDQGYIRPDDFLALVNSPHLKSLTHLALYLTDIGDAEMAALVASGKLKQLRVLDLWNSRVSDAGARTLAACPDLRRLEKLRLANNQLTPEGITALAATGVNLDAGGQYTADAIGELQHLWEGDCE